MSSNIVQRIAMKALIVKDGKVLILREAATYDEGTNVGKYHLPGGRIEPGEYFEDALHREVMEETGLKVEIEYPMYVGEWRPVIKGVPNQIVATFFVCKPKTTQVTLSTEHDAYEWISPGSYKQFNLMDPEDKVFERFLQSQKRK